MKNIIICIGSVVFSLIMYAIPILLTCAFCFKWDAFTEWILCIFAAGQICFIAGLIAFKVTKNE